VNIGTLLIVGVKLHQSEFEMAYTIIQIESFMGINS